MKLMNTISFGGCFWKFILRIHLDKAIDIWNLGIYYSVIYNKEKMSTDIIHIYEEYIIC